MRFVAIDVETANARMRSICQIGIVVFEHGKEVASDVVLINPGEEFDGMNISIHGIDESQVVGEKTFPQVSPWLAEYARDQVVVCHTHFDRVAITQAHDHHRLPAVSCRWLDTAKVARRAWPQFAQSGYGIRNLANSFGIPFRHHDALEDARTAGLILLRAIDQSGQDLDQWLFRVKLSLSGHPKGGERRDGDGDGPLLGETVVFTGSLSIPRREAADLAHMAGGAVDTGVTKATTVLVVGDQDLLRTNGNPKSSKHLKAEGLAATGQPIRFLAETDFMALVAE
ncbi:transposase [Mesorhizobium sp. B3-1-6]|uniref:exonuclease domain-containing protein n=1 Tax=Mesorhizobium sp. B3-1-6 TaxID=2589895 RepID=UPI001128B10D|nr:exonuclease domain-containing protein [Mesorhizobium sp. B3-1-6]TPI31160.1 transposase [Mesorhizobium sp. B3-1-6]